MEQSKEPTLTDLIGLFRDSPVSIGGDCDEVIQTAKLCSISIALHDYHQALSRREHGGVAAMRFVSECEKILEQPWKENKTSD